MGFINRKIYMETKQTKMSYKEINDILMYDSEVNCIVNFIKSMPENGLMVEWGCGGSTLKWIETLSKNQKLISIEHNVEWYNKVKNAIHINFSPNVVDNFTFIHQQPQTEYIHGYGAPSEENPVGLAKYICPTNNIYDADIYLIDGIARSTIALSVFLQRRKKNSIVLIHDFAWRPEWYNVVGQFCEVKTIGTLGILILK
jgi:hypothetical protein